MKLPISILSTGQNTALPPIFAPFAASFWAQLLFVLSALCNIAGIDLFTVFKEMGLGNSPDEVIATGQHTISTVQQLITLFAGVWSYIERKAPRFRLTFWPTKNE